MKKKKRTRKDNQPLDKNKQDLVNKIRKKKNKKLDEMLKNCKKDQIHCEFWQSERKLGKPIQELSLSQCTTSVNSCQEKKCEDVVAKELTKKITLWQWIKSFFSR